MRHPKADSALAEEFRTVPFARHSRDLQNLLDFFRHEPFPGKHVLVCTKPYREWVVAQLSGVRGEAPRPLAGHVYASVADAEWAVFKLRWHKHFGKEI